jgi:hypothetical protein
VNGTTAVAGYGAVVSTLAVGWNVYTWRQTHYTKLAVTARLAVLNFARSTAAGIGITVENKTRNPIEVVEMGLFNESAHGEVRLSPYPPDDLPKILPGRESFEFAIARRFEDANPYGTEPPPPMSGYFDPLWNRTGASITFWVKTSSGSRFSSEPFVYEGERLC